MKKIKLFSFDLDGTLLNDKRKISDSTLEAFSKAQKNNFFLVANTGRSYYQMNEILSDYGHFFDYLICNNGSYIYDKKSGTFQHFCELESEILFQMIEKVEHLQPYIAVNTLNGTYVAKLFDEIAPEWHNDAVEKDWNSQTEVFHTLEEIKNKIVNEIVVQVAFSTTEKLSKYIKDHLLIPFKDKVSTFISWPTNVDVNPLNSNKLAGLEQLTKLIDIPLSSVASFGDSENDIEMIRGSGLGFAMGNASNELKEVANEVIGDNNTDAIAKKILQIINATLIS